MSSYFLFVKMSYAVMFAFAWPCLPVFENEMSEILQGWPLGIIISSAGGFNITADDLRLRPPRAQDVGFGMCKCTGPLGRAS